VIPYLLAAGLQPGLESVSIEAWLTASAAIESHLASC